MPGTRLLIVHVLIAVLVTTPAVCCGQIAAAAADSQVAAASPQTDDCPGHARTTAAGEAARGIGADACSGCALLSAIPNSADQAVPTDDVPDLPWLAVVTAPEAGVLRRSSPRDRPEWPGHALAAADTPVTRFDRLLIPG